VFSIEKPTFIVSRNNADFVEARKIASEARTTTYASIVGQNISRSGQNRRSGIVQQRFSSAEQITEAPYVKRKTLHQTEP